MPMLKSKALKGVDLWQKLNFAISPPVPTVSHPNHCRLDGGTHAQKDEDRQQQNFLDEELSKFDRVQGPTG